MSLRAHLLAARQRHWGGTGGRLEPTALLPQLWAWGLEAGAAVSAQPAGRTGTTAAPQAQPCVFPGRCGLPGWRAGRGRGQQGAQGSGARAAPHLPPGDPLSPAAGRKGAVRAQREDPSPAQAGSPAGCGGAPGQAWLSFLDTGPEEPAWPGPGADPWLRSRPAAAAAFLSAQPASGSPEAALPGFGWQTRGGGGGSTAAAPPSTTCPCAVPSGG